MINDHPEKLTHLEFDALDAPVNVSDAHPRQSPTASQAAILADFDSIFARVDRDLHSDIECEAQHAFFTVLGQHAYPRGRVRSLYASSVAIDVVARLVAEGGRRVALLEPTFDNIRDLLEARGLELAPVTERALRDEDPRDILEKADCLFITSPNNPTGSVLNRERLTCLAKHCAAADVLLVIDASFRGFDARAQYDTYAVLERVAVRYLVIEDTGKLWPTHELKLGFLACSASIANAVKNAADDVLLSVSPVVLELVLRLSRDAASGGFSATRELVEGNRAALAEAVENTAAQVVCPDSRVSVALVELPAYASAGEVWERMTERHVHVLPANAFFWSDPTAGNRYVRVALSREPDEVARAGAMLAEVLCELDPRAATGSVATKGSRGRRILNLQDVSADDPFAKMTTGFRAVSANRSFPCPFVARAVARQTIWCGEINGTDAGIERAHDVVGDYLDVISREADPKAGAFNVLLLGCPVPDGASGDEVRDIAWELLLKLSACDSARGFAWPEEIPVTIDDPRWAYCIREVPLFVNVSSDRLRGRLSRNLGYGLTLVFQPRDGIDLIAPPNGEGDQLREHIRRRVDRYDALERSPELSSYGASESRDWRQFWLEETNMTSNFSPPVPTLRAPSHPRSTSFGLNESLEPG